MGRFCEFFCVSVCFMVVQLFCGFVVCRFCFGLVWDVLSFVRCPVIVSFWCLYGLVGGFWLGVS